MPGQTDRATFLGQTGTGKTTLAQTLLEQRDYVVVFDTKGRIQWPGYHLHTDFAKLTRDDHPHLIWRPSFTDLRNPGLMNRAWGWIYLRKRTTAYADELKDHMVGQLAPPNYERCVTRGREHEISVWSGTQRPSKIPMVALSESETYFVFYLKLPQDRERAEELTGIDYERIETLPKHVFMWARQDEPAPAGPYRLRMTGSTTPPPSQRTA
jgi:hypothetical protein